MKTSTKRFLIFYFVAYILVALGINAWLGPPGMSEEYLDAHKRDHDRYLSIVKDDEYKLWTERPELNPPDDALAAEIAFVEEYTARPAFQAEMDRRKLYEILFDFFRVFMVVLLAVHFGRKPAVRWVEGKIAEIRHRIERVESEREVTKEAREAADKKLELFPHEREAYDADTEARIAREKERVAELTAQAMAMLEQETKERKQYEEMLAEKRLKEGVIDAAMAVVLEQYANTRTAEQEQALLDSFLIDIEAKR